MFKLVESSHTDPVRMAVAPGTNFKPGHIAQIKEIEGNIFCELSNGSCPFGIVGTLTDLNMIRVYPQKMVFRTSTYQSDKKYKEGCALYVSKNGILTSEAPFTDALYVARMITPPDNSKKYLEALWI